MHKNIVLLIFKYKKKSRKSLKLCFEDFEVHAHQAPPAQAARSAQLNVTSEFRLENKCTYTVWSASSQIKNKNRRQNCLFFRSKNSKYSIKLFRNIFCSRSLQIFLYQVGIWFWESKIVLGHDALNCCFENLKESEISVYKKVNKCLLRLLNLKTLKI